MRTTSFAPWLENPRRRAATLAFALALLAAPDAASGQQVASPSPLQQVAQAADARVPPASRSAGAPIPLEPGNTVSGPFLGFVEFDADPATPGRVRGLDSAPRTLSPSSR